jgi:FtsP/CotA-like multicopper oxidase with cupredoxin domain
MIGAAAVAAGATLDRPRAARAAGPLRLRADRRTLSVNGRAASVYGLGPAPGESVRRFTAGERFTVTLENALNEPTLVHWHGLTPPSAEDGTPDLSQPPLAAGAHYDYDFPLRRPGTFWMHSHVGFQRAQLLAAPLIIGDAGEAERDEQEVVIFLSDFSFRAPDEIFASLTGGKGAMHGMSGMGGGSHDMQGMNGGSMAMDGKPMAHGAMAQMAMGDVNDIDFDAYLANDRTLADPAMVRVEPGGHVRLRIINAAAATNFWIVLGALSGELIAVDGDPVMPVSGARFPLAMAQRLDLRLRLPAGQGAYPILALREGAAERTGIVLATAKGAVQKLEAKGAAAPALDLALERKLRAAEPLSAQSVSRELVAELTGDMTGYVWGINGKTYGHDVPFNVRKGERVLLVMRNRTMMAHPMHLHGHHFQVAAIGNDRIAGALRDTVLVPAMGSVAVALDADNPGRWAFHCHNAYHMAAGMMTSLQYEA